MRIAVIGGGVAGMLAAIYMKKNNHSVSLFSKQLGGEYAAGGLKYIKYTDDVVNFFKNVLNMDDVFRIRKINGAILLHDGSIKSYPSFIQWQAVRNYSLASKLQREYWNKTRDGSFDERCMNDPWMFHDELAIDLDLKNFTNDVVDICKSEIDDIVLTDVDKNMIVKMVNDYDKIIYTIPLHIILNTDGVRFQILNLIKYTPQLKIENIWWDYLYVPDSYWNFHRVDYDSVNNELTFEINDKNLKQYYLYNINEFIVVKLNCQDAKFKNDRKIKGHISEGISPDAKEIIRNDFGCNMVLLGRYAEMDKRIKLDNVIGKIISEDFLKGI